MFDEDACEVCGSCRVELLGVLGVLGTLEHYRCRSCGLQSSRPAKDAIRCTECGQVFHDNDYNTDLGDGCHCHAG